MERKHKRKSIVDTFGASFVRSMLSGAFSLFLFAPLSLAATVTIPADAVETPYIWKRSDSLSKALFSLGLGQDGTGPKLYGRRGWVARNKDFYKGENWESTPEGTRLLLLTPRPFTEVRGSVTDEAATIQQIKVLPLKAQRSSIALKSPRSQRSKDLGLGLFLLGLVALAYYSYWLRTKLVREKKVATVANSILVWLTSNGQHTSEHINLATTLFIGELSDHSLVAYEVMGYFNQDCDQLAIFKDRSKELNGSQAREEAPTSDQDEYLLKYLFLAPEVISNIMGSATLPFLQVQLLRRLTQFASMHSIDEKHPHLAQSMADACARYPSLIKDPKLRDEVRSTLKALESLESMETAA